MLEMGKSKPWPFALEKMTGSKEMSVAPMKEYFQPLQEWLENERCSKKYKVGWPGQSADGVKKCPTVDISSTEKPTGTISSTERPTGTLWFLVTVISLIQSLA